MEQTVNIERMDQTLGLFGNFDANIRALERAFGVSIIVRQGDSGDLKVSGDAAGVDLAVRAINALLDMLSRGEALTDQSVGYVISMVSEGASDALYNLADNGCVCITAKGKPIKPKTVGQQRYVNAIDSNTIVFGIGPAGTGKTYLAVAKAVAAFRAKEVNRIILTRPAVEAGEKLGFLPGDLQQKVDPYLRPLYDALFDMLGAENYARYHERGNIEIAPLAYMRGRTLDERFIILDE